MIIDMHYHLDERMEPIDRLIEQMDRNRIDRVALVPPMVDPFHVEGVAEGLARFVRRLLMGRWQTVGRLAYESTVTKNGNFSILGKMYAIDQEPDNDLVSRAMERYPERFYGWFFINPAREDAVAKLESGFSSTGWIGVKCHPFWHRYPVRDLDAAAAWCVEKKVPLLLHLGGKPDNGDFRYLPERHSDLNLIYAHAGVPYYGKLWPYVKEKKNVYIDLSSPYLDEPLRRAAVEGVGPGKCLYGTDGPFGYPAPGDHKYDHGAILAEIERFPLSMAEKERILGGNFAEMVGL